MSDTSIYFLTVNYYSVALIRKLVSSIFGGDLSPNPSPQWRGEQGKVYLVIANNAIDDHEISELEHDGITIIHATDNLGFGQACNLGLTWIYERDASAFVWLINPDAYLADGAIANLNALLQAHREIAILGTSVCDPSGQLCFGGGRFKRSNGAIWEETKPDASISPDAEYMITDWVTACSMVINLSHFSQCPHFDPDYFLYYEDFDFCCRYNKQGYQIYFSDRIKVFHQTSSVTSRDQHFKIANEIYSYLISLEKHASILILSLRLVRIAIASVLQMLYAKQTAIAKLTGIGMYCQRILRNLNHKINRD